MENRIFFGYSQLCRSRFLYVKRHFTYSTICEWYSVIFGLGVITQRSYPHFMIPTRIENRTCHIATRLVLYRQIITAEITYTLYVKTKVLYVNDTLRFSNEKLPHNICQQLSMFPRRIVNRKYFVSTPCSSYIHIQKYDFTYSVFYM